MWSNFHTHSAYCDGKATLAEILDSAVAQNLISLGLSSHAPLPVHLPWCMNHEDFERYLLEIDTLKKKNKPVEIYSGLEIDYIPGKISPRDFAHRLDYTIGSIHFVDAFADGRGWEVDAPHAIFREGFELIFKKNIREVIRRYFELTREMILQSNPAVLGHMDKIKIQNAYGSYFDESEGWYVAEVKKTVDVLKNSPAIVEVNTRGLYQKKSATPYPSPWILELLHQHHIPVTISSDAHHPDDLTNQFSTVAGILLKIGFKKIRILLNGKWQDVTFDMHGITPH